MHLGLRTTLVALAIGTTASLASAQSAATKPAATMSPATKLAAKRFGTRAAMTCKELTLPKGPPSPAQAARLAQCHSESNFGRSIYLMDSVSLEIGKPRHFESSDLLLATGADVHAPIYPIRGSFTEVSCGEQVTWKSYKGRNCTITPVTEDTGLCWKTAFGDWRCGLGGRDMKQGAAMERQPPPADLAAR